MSLILRFLWITALMAGLYGCATSHQQGLDLFSTGELEAGVAKLGEAVKADPNNVRFRADLTNKRNEAINRLLTQANAEYVSNHLAEAQIIYQRVFKIDPENERATAGMKAIIRDRRHAELIEQAATLFKKGDIEKAFLVLKPVISENPSNSEMLVLKRAIEAQQFKEFSATPTLKSLYKKPVTLEFRDAPLKMVFEVLSRTTGINFVLDKDIRSDIKVTLFLKQSSLEDAVDLLLATNQVEKKILNENSVLIYPNTPAKTKEYQDLILKSFYIANADVKQTLSMVKTFIKTKDIYADEKLNLLIMRDTPDAIRLAEKLIALQDLGEPEVMLEVEVIEIQRSRLLDLGIQFPNQLTLAPIASNGSTVTLNDVKNLGSSRISASLSNMIINAKKEDGDVNILANPRIRVKNREKAKILIGDKVPIITTTTTSTGFISESVQYVDVGLKLEVEPNIYLQDDVSIKIALEVSSIVREIKSTTGTLSYQIGTRNATTVLRLKDGETEVLAGLINDQDRKTASKVPGLGDLPLLGRLFSSHRSDNQKTEIILSITPRLVRNIQRPEVSAEEFWSGTETTLRTKPLTLPALKEGDRNKTVVASSSGLLAETSNVNQSTTAMNAQEKHDIPVGGKTILSWQGPQQVKKGEEFSITLRIKSDETLRSSPLQINFDQNTLQLVEVNEGGFFKQNSGQTNFAGNIDQTNGKLFVGIARSGDEGASGEEGLVVMNFKALAEKLKTEIRVLTITPITTNGEISKPALPAPHVLSIGN